MSASWVIGACGMLPPAVMATEAPSARHAETVSPSPSPPPVQSERNRSQQGPHATAPALIDRIDKQAQSLTRLRTLLVAQNGEVLLARGYHGGNVNRPVNIKSASKVIISALVGRAIAEEKLSGADASIKPLLKKRLPADANPRLDEISIEDLLTMRAGLERTSGVNYGRWVASRDWVGYAVSRPFADEPGGRMLYSTGSTHLLSAILTDASGRDTRDLANTWLFRPLGVSIGAWDRDPQGIYLGGNNMALSPRALLAFGEMMRNGGQVNDEQIVPRDWILASWTPRTQSQFTGDGYGYGWFITEAQGHPVYYAWGFGGQMLYIVPAVGLTVVMTSAIDQPSGNDGYLQQLHSLLKHTIVPELTTR